MSGALLEVEGVGRSFRRGTRTVVALDGVDLRVAAGETVALVGASGSGKTTLARVIVRLIEADRGRIRFEGRDWSGLSGAALRALRPRMQMVFQDPLAAFNPRASVGRAIADPLRVHRLVPAAAIGTRVGELLERVGLAPALAGRAIHEISGGQRQRVAIARAIASDPALLILDEAVSALDVSVRGQILELIGDLQRERGTAHLFVSHDLAAVRAVAERIYVIDAGRIVETGKVEDVLRAPRSEVTARLIAAVPRLPPSLPPIEDDPR